MAVERRVLRGTTAQTNAYTGGEGAITVDTTKKTAVIHDGTTAGGFPLAHESHTHIYTDLVNLPTIPTATSELTNDSGFITTADLPANFSGDYADLTNKPTIPTTTSALTNDSGFITAEDLPASFSGSYNDLTDKPTLFSGAYADLTGKPTIPVTTSALTNDSGFITAADIPAGFSGSYDDLTDKPALFSGDYADLANKPTLFSGAYADLTGKPTIPTATSALTNDSGFITAADIPAGFSGDYADLTNKPALFSGSYTDLTNKPTIPTATSALTNDSGFITTADIPAGFSGSYADLTDVPATFAPSAHSHVITDVTGLQDALNAKAVASDVYTKTETDNKIAGIVNSAPAALDTLNELAAALGNDANFATTVSTQIGLKANSADLATVATSGSYTDLSNKPTLFSGSYTDLTNKPVLFSGSYTDLTSKPTLFSGSYNDLTNKPERFTPTSHTHTISEVTGLQTALDGKATSAQGAKADTAIQPNDLLYDQGISAGLVFNYQAMQFEYEGEDMPYKTWADVGGNFIERSEQFVLGLPSALFGMSLRIKNLEENPGPESIDPATISYNQDYAPVSELEKYTWSGKADAGHFHSKIQKEDDTSNIQIEDNFLGYTQITTHVDSTLCTITQADMVSFLVQAVMENGLVFQNLVNAPNDQDAETAGVPVGGVYRNGSQLMIRVE